MKEIDEKKILLARSEYSKFKVAGEKNFKAFGFKSELEIFKSKMSTSFEELGCVGYHPLRRELTAHIRIKRATGYAGDLCERGSFEYVRFYLDYGSGWEDQGYVGLNVHDIPTEKDCAKKPEKPIDYVVRLRIKPKSKRCSIPVLPKVKAVLSWNSIPAPNDPNLLTPGIYVWGDVKEDHIQIRPRLIFYPGTKPDLEIENNFFKQTPSISNVPHFDFQANKFDIVEKVDFQDLLNNYADKKIPAERFGYSLLKEAELSDNSLINANVKNLFASNKLGFAEAYKAYLKLKCNTNFEELFCLGADYNKEALVGTLRIKKPFGYNGTLCQKGTKEYVTFWIQNPKTCAWENVGTSSISAHDISSIPSTGLSYSVILPFNFDKYKQDCKSPQVLKVKAVLSWNSIPTSTSCSGYGNVIESYIQLRPSIQVGIGPKLIAVGGISVQNIYDSSGLTKPGTKFRENQNDVYNYSPFGGKIVVEGVSWQNYGMGYKVRIQNNTNGASYYLNSSFTVEDVNGNSNTIVPVANVYPYQTFNDNPDNILANFKPGSNDNITIFIEHLDGTSAYQTIQLDNTFPVVSLVIDDNGNCTHYTKGSDIIGEFSVNDNYLERYAISTNLGTYQKTGPGTLNQSGTVNGNGNFIISTLTSINCGNITLNAIQKTIWDSAYTGTHRQVSKTVCLK